MTGSVSDYVFNGEEIKFCPGPCKSTKLEEPPTKLSNELRYQFKPYSGGNYPQFTWIMSNGNYVTVKNIRPCAFCYSLYDLLCSSDVERHREMIYGEAVFEKLKDFTPEVVTPEVVTPEVVTPEIVTPEVVPLKEAQ
jgi:hypothetical protein